MLVGDLGESDDPAATPSDPCCGPLADRLLLSLHPTDEIAAVSAAAMTFAILVRQSSREATARLAATDSSPLRPPSSLQLSGHALVVRYPAPPDGENGPRASALPRGQRAASYAPPQDRPRC